MAVDKKVVIEFEFLASQGLEAIEQTKKQILDLKTQKEVLKLQNKEETKEYALLDAQLKNLNKTLKSQQSALEANLKAIEANDGSLKSMREQLKSLVTAYDSLGKAERESESGQALAQKIAGLTQEIKDLEYETERYQRNVGNYGNSIREALQVDTTPLKTQLRQLTAELQSLTLAQRQLGESMKTMTDPQEIAEAQAQYDKLGSAINDTAAKAGVLKDTVEDTGKVISAQADDYPAISALNEGITALVDSYTVLKGVTTALGIENDRLLDVMAKVHVLQQSVNALNRIAIALDKAKNGALAIQQTSFWKLVTAKMADRKASLAQAKANATLTASEGAATLGAGALRKALIALRTAFMSIPGIGWIAAAATAIAALTVKIVKARKEAKDMNDQIKEMGKDDPMREIFQGANEEVRKTSVELSACADMALKAANGSKEQEYWVRKVAEQTGLSYDFLKAHVDILPQVVEQYINAAKAAAAFKKGIDIQVELENQQYEWNKILEDIGGLYDVNMKTWKKKVKTYLEENVSDAMKATKAYKKLLEDVNNASGFQFRDMMNQYAKNSKEIIDNQVEENKERLKELGEDQAEAEKAMEDIRKKAGQTTVKTNQTTAKAIESIWQKLYTKTLPQLLKEYDKETDEMLKDMAKKGVDAGTQAVYAAQRALGKANVIDTFTKGSKTMLADVSKDITALFDLLGNLQQKRAMEFGSFRIEKRDLDAKDRENLTNIMNKTLEIIAGYDDEFRKKLTDLLGFGKLEFDDKGVVSNLDAIIAKIGSLQTPKEFEEFIQKLRDGIRDMNREILKGDTDIDKANSIVLKDMQDFLTYLNRIKELSETVLPVVRNIQLEFSKLDTVSDTALRDLTTEINTALAEIYGDLPETVSDIAGIEVKIRAKLDEQALEQAQIKLDNAKAKLQELENTPVEIRAQWGEGFDKMMDEAKAAVAQAEMEMNKTMHDARVRDLKDAEQTAKEKKQAQVDSYMAIGQAASDAFGTLSQMFDQLAEQDSRYAKFSKAFALMQILTSTAMSIASAVQGASAAGAATGVAAPFTTPVFIAEMIAIVLGAIASATSLLSQAKMPHFAYGGYVDRGTTSKADDVHAMVSRGEYIVQADAVKMYGKDYFDSLNAGLVRGDMDISNALRAALEDMPSPIVSVKEINNMQSRVRVKEDISRGKIN